MDLRTLFQHAPVGNVVNVVAVATERMRVELKHVWRTYHVADEDVLALRDATVTIEPGEFIAHARTQVHLKSLGFVFQRFHLLNQISALENVMLHGGRGARFEERHSRATVLSDQVGFADRLSFEPTQLSGGQRHL